jgi:hypothetical protein
MCSGEGAGFWDARLEARVREPRVELSERVRGEVRAVEGADFELGGARGLVGV